MFPTVPLFLLYLHRLLLLFLFAVLALWSEGANLLDIVWCGSELRVVAFVLWLVT
ncbi:hypothetical protein BDV25DRAFT_162128 [Aspergillus avenaceus]|uniref:Uncharacterized protein n=1 Tax=Aspergillus avenaceus TaxID=36643 RepID=A0A5N6TJU3_ASPAV|nr:hypothetical protein BDV25DRAFT_162128 [Aspergillus avenaceus]